MIKKVWEQNDSKKGGRSVWEEWFVHMILEMLLHGTPPTCTSYLDWCVGTVVAIISELARKVRIKWDVECLRTDDPIHTVDKLLKLQWNPVKAKKGAWREYLVK